MARGLPPMQLINGRWRGIMPFRQSLALRKQFDLKRRTGEPSPAWYPEGYGKAFGSHTEQMRMLLWAWMKEKYGSGLHSLTFEYKLYRKRIITVVGTYPYIKHRPHYGKGKKGFILEIAVLSIDGMPYRGLGRRAFFAWDRIIGKENFLALPSAILDIAESGTARIG